MPTETVIAPPSNVAAFTSIRNTLPAGHSGMPLSTDRDTMALFNAALVAKVVDVQVVTVTNSATYTFYIDDTAIEVTADGTATTDEIRTLIRNAVAASMLSGLFTTVANEGGDEVRFTARKGMDPVFRTSDAKLAIVTVTAMSRGTTMYFGDFVCRSSDGLGVIPPAGVSAVAQVTTLAFSAASNSATYYVNIRMLGGTYEGYTYSGLYVADGSATAQEIVEGIAADLNAKLPANTVAVTEDNSTLTFTGEVAGAGFAIDANVTDPAITLTGPTDSTANVEAALTTAIFGVIELDYAHVNGVINPLDGFTAGRRGPYAIELEQAPPSVGAQLYLRHTAGADATTQRPGRLRFDSDSGKAVALDTSSIFLIDSATDNMGRYRVQVNYPRVAA